MDDKHSRVADVVVESRRVLSRALVLSALISLTVVVIGVSVAAFAFYSSVSDVLQTRVDSKLAEISAQISPPSGLPIGTVLAYPAESSTLPDGFLVCDGRTLSKQAYPELFAILGVRYGGDGDSFQIPDYSGLFLRGVHGKRELGALQEDSIGKHPHDLVVEGAPHSHGSFQVAAASTGTVYLGSKDGLGPTRLPQASGQTITIGGGAHTHKGKVLDVGGDETRPKNISVNWIIRAKLPRDLQHGALTSLPTDRR